MNKALCFNYLELFEQKWSAYGGASKKLERVQFVMINLLSSCQTLICIMKHFFFISGHLLHFCVVLSIQAVLLRDISASFVTHVRIYSVKLTFSGERMDTS